MNGQVIIRLKVEVSNPDIEVIVKVDKVVKVNYEKPTEDEKKRVLINPHPIIETVCKVHGVSVEAAMSKSRKREFVSARRQIYAVLLNYKGFKLSEAGAVFDGQDHTTALWAKTKHDDDMKYVPQYRELFEKVLEKLKLKTNEEPNS